MKRLLVLLVPLLVAVACVAPPPNFDGVTLYFVPEVKYVAEPRYAFSSIERQYALREYRNRGANTLFEFVVDSDGKVKKARLLRTSIGRQYRDSMELHARGMVFSKDTEPDRYRAFYYPVDYDFNASFEWQ